MPKIISEFRNKVIHQGYIPCDKEVVKYGEQVFQVIRQIEQVAEGFGKALLTAYDTTVFDAQLAEVPRGMTWIKLKATLVKINENNEVVGSVASFTELLAALAKRVGKQ